MLQKRIWLFACGRHERLWMYMLAGSQIPVAKSNWDKDN